MNCQPNCVRVEVAKYDDRSCSESTCESSESSFDHCPTIFTACQTQKIHEIVNEGVLHSNKTVDIINNKVNVTAEQNACFRADISRKVVCVEKQIACIATIEARLCRIDNLIECQFQRRDNIINELAKKLVENEAKTCAKLKVLEENIRSLTDAYCGIESFRCAQQQFDATLGSVVARLAAIEAIRPNCDISQPRIAQLPLGGPYGAPNPLAGRPLYPPGPSQNGAGPMSGWPQSDPQQWGAAWSMEWSSKGTSASKTAPRNVDSPYSTRTWRSSVDSTGSSGSAGSISGTTVVTNCSESCAKCCTGSC